MPTVKRNKKTVTVTAAPELIQEAKAYGVNLSQTFENAIRAELHSIQVARWQKDNAQAIDYLNKLSEENGLFSDEYRTF